MTGIQVLDRSASQNLYAVAGRLLCIQCLDLSLATRIERLFNGWQLTRVSFPERNPDIKITFACDHGLPAVPAGLNHFEVAAGGRCYTTGDEYYLQFQHSLLRLQQDNTVSISVFISRPTDVELARITSFAVCAGLRRFGVFEIHSAGVVIPGTDAGLLIVGPSGSGKSTLTLQLATAGWGYLSDDELLLSLNGEAVEARGFRSFFALAPAAPSADGALKTYFEPAGFFAAPPVTRAAARFVLFTAISGTDETHLRELTQPEIMTRLIRACPWATYDTAIAGANLQLLSRLARQVKGFDLRAGTDLLEPRRASRIISSFVMPK